MGFTTKCFIRINTRELQDKLKEMGYLICPCCNAKNAVWLDNNPHSSSIHGIGYSDETASTTVEEELARFTMETDAIDCGTNEELFLALAAKRDDTSDNQYWVFDRDFPPRYKKGDFTIGHFPRCSCCCHLATAKELIEHFK